jgi:holin-like protein
MAIIEPLALLLLCQLVGEAAVRASGLPVPGPVLGLVLLAALAAWRGISPNLHATAHGLLRNLSLLFVPAGVGIIRQAHLLATYWLAIGVALVVSTLATLVVTVLVFRWAHRRFGGEEASAP